MFRFALLLSVCCAFMVDGAYAARDIVLLHGDPNKVTINDVDGTIEITDGDPNTFVFECYDGANPANIEFIGTSGTPTGTITISILPDTGHTYGAASVWEIDLTGATFTGQIEDITISGNLATEGDVVCDNITGDLDIGGNLGKIGLPYTKLSATTISGAITIGGTLVASDTLEAGTLGNVTIEGVGVNPVQGDIKIGNNYSGTLAINHKFSGDITIGDPNDPNAAANLVGAISVTGVNTGLVNVTGHVSGTISIDANLNDPGRIVIGGDVSQSDPNVPVIHIGGGVVGSSASATPIVIGGELDGVLAIDGPLENVAPSAVEIQVGSIDPNDPNSLGAIAIDYDGWQLG